MPISPGDGGATVWANNVTLTLANKLDAATAVSTYVPKAYLWVNVKDFGAVGDGVHNDTTAIQAAIDYAKTLVRNAGTTKHQDGAVVYFPKGLYLISSTLLIDESNIMLIGESWSSTVIYAPAATFDLVKFDNPSFALYNCGIGRLRFSTPGNTTAGFHLKVMHAIYFTASDILFNGWFGGLYIGGCAKMFNSQLIFSQEVRTAGTTTGAAIDMSCDYTYSSDVHFTDLQIMEDVATAGLNAFIVRGVDGLYIENMHMHGTFLVNPSNTGNEVVVSTIEVTNGYFDTSRDACAVISGTASAAYKDLTFTNCRFRGGVTGLRIATTTTLVDLKVAASRFAQNSQNGMEVNNHNVNGLVLSSVTFDSNNSGNSASYGDLYLNGNALSVSDAHFYGGGALGFGIKLDAATSLAVLNGIDFINSAAANKITNLGGYTSMKGIVGWNVKVKGTVTIPISATTATITHFCKVTPLLESIRLTPAASCPAYWITAIGATTFQVNFASAVAAAFTMGYSVDMEF